VFPCKNKAGKISSCRGAYVGPGGKRRYVSGKPKVDARRNFRKARGDAERGLVSDGGNVRLSEYLTRWLNDSVKGSVKLITHQSYEMLVNKHVVPALAISGSRSSRPRTCKGSTARSWTRASPDARFSTFMSSCIGRSSRRSGGGL
jgi:hypothetical protein